MRYFKLMSVLSASMLALLATNASAELAGRVVFAAGAVNVTSADGAARVLNRGDSINSGDRISTGTGRVQIRFMDGGFIALQPNTEFGVDQYVFSNKKPTETSSVFNLIRGGMRTITGTIGKINKQSYRVRTPVATIGIRGTGYLASVSDAGGLDLSVSHGFVNVANASGDITAGVGQNIVVSDANSAPKLSGKKAQLSTTTAAGATVQLNQEVNYVDRFILSPRDKLKGPNGDVSVNFTTLFKTELSSSGKLVSFYEDKKGGASFQAGGLKVIESGSLPGINWGVYANGTSGDNTFFDPAGAFSLGENEFVPYLVAEQAINLPKSGLATFEYNRAEGKGFATTHYGADARVKNQLDLMRVTYDFSPQAMATGSNVSILMELTSATTSYKVTQSASAQGSFFANQNLGNVMINGTTTCTSCTAVIEGLIVGANANYVGATYSLTNSTLVAQGVAVLPKQ